MDNQDCVDEGGSVTPPQGCVPVHDTQVSEDGGVHGRCLGAYIEAFVNARDGEDCAFCSQNSGCVFDGKAKSRYRNAGNDYLSLSTVTHLAASVKNRRVRYRLYARFREEYNLPDGPLPQCVEIGIKVMFPCPKGNFVGYKSKAERQFNRHHRGHGC